MREVTLRLSAHEMHEIVKALGERRAEYSAELYLRMKKIFYNWNKLPEVEEPKLPNCKCTAIMFSDDGELSEKEIDGFAEKVAEIFGQQSAEIPTSTDISHSK